MNIATELVARRRTLLEEFAGMPRLGNPVEWQRRLTAEHIKAERQARAQRELMREHRDLLRLIGDNLAWALLPRHTLRALARHPGGPPPGLASQVATMHVVWETAELLLANGFVPIVADLTNLIRIGDVVGWNAHQTVVLECKNQPAPGSITSTGGRATRQRQRGEDLEEYLQSSSIEEGPRLTRQAIPGPELPEPDWAAVGSLILGCLNSSDGVSTLRFSDSDMIVAAEISRAEISTFMTGLELNRKANLELLFFSELMDEPSFVARPPSAYPIGADLVSHLLERKVVLFRLADLSVVAGRFKWGRTEGTLEARRDKKKTAFTAMAGGYTSSFEWPVVDYFLWSQLPVLALRHYLLESAPTALDLVAEADEPLLAGGENVLYGTVYSASPTDPVVVARNRYLRLRPITMTDSSDYE